MKNVVLPESPYGVCTTRSVPRPCARRQRGQLRPASRRRAEHVRHRRRTGLVAELGRDDLGVEPAAQRVRRAGSGRSRARAQISSVSSSKKTIAIIGRAAAPAAGGPAPRVAQQVVVDLLAGLELDVGLVLRREHPRVRAVPGVVVDDVLEVAHPAVDAEQVERGRARRSRSAGVLVRKNVRISEIPLSCWRPRVPTWASARLPRSPGCRGTGSMSMRRSHVTPGGPVAATAEPGDDRRRRRCVRAPWRSRSASRSRRRRRRRAACPGGTPGSARSGQLDSFTHTVPVRRLTCTIWPWMPRQSRTSPCSPGRNQNWLRYHPPGKDASAGDVEEGAAAVGVDGPGPAQPARGYDAARTVVASGTVPPSSSIWPNRSRSRAVAAARRRGRRCRGASQMISASCSAPIGAHTSSEIRSAIRRPAARSQTQPEHVGLGGAVAERLAVRRLRRERRRGTRRAPRTRRPGPPTQLSMRAHRRPGRRSPRGTAPRCACRAGAGPWRRRSRCPASSGT